MSGVGEALIEHLYSLLKHHFVSGEPGELGGCPHSILQPQQIELEKILGRQDLVKKGDWEKPAGSGGDRGKGERRV